MIVKVGRQEILSFPYLCLHQASNTTAIATNLNLCKALLLGIINIQRANFQIQCNQHLLNITCPKFQVPKINGTIVTASFFCEASQLCEFLNLVHLS